MRLVPRSPLALALASFLLFSVRQCKATIHLRYLSCNSYTVHIIIDTAISGSYKLDLHNTFLITVLESGQAFQIRHLQSTDLIRPTTSSTMSTTQDPQPSSHSESKSAKKKKAKAEATAQPPTAPPEPDAAAGQTATDGTTNGVDGAYESPYLKELYK